jgi:hypothetical protein
MRFDSGRCLGIQENNTKVACGSAKKIPEKLLSGRWSEAENKKIINY